MAYINRDTLEVFDIIPEIETNFDRGLAMTHWLYADEIVAEVAVQLLKKGYPVCGASGSIYDLLNADAFDSEYRLDNFLKISSNVGYATPYEKVIELRPGGHKTYHALAVYPTAGVSIQIHGCLNIEEYFVSESDIKVHCENCNDDGEDNPLFKYTVISASVTGETWAERLQNLIQIVTKLLHIIQIMPSLR